MIGILGKKIGMTRIHDSNGKSVPVTVIEAMPSEVLSVKTTEKHGYPAVQLGTGDFKKRKKNTPKKRFIREIRMAKNTEYKVGDMVKVDIFSEGDYVDVIGTTKGKGFAGGIKRYGWKGGDSGHGSMHHRAPGSIGSNTFPGRVLKGKGMPGHLGHVRQTTQNLKVIKIDAEKNMIAIKGPVPGHDNSFILVKESIKRPKKVEKKDAAKK